MKFDLMKNPIVLLVLVCFLAAAQTNAVAAQAADDYATYCASCHGTQRLGGAGPALLPGNLGRLKPKQAHAVIRDGRLATQMPAFGKQLQPLQIEALVDLIYTQPLQQPQWREANIVRSHNKFFVPLKDQKPLFKADPLNLFVVVETGDHHASILDGDTFEVLKRIPTRYALHGGPKFSPDGRYVFFGSRDGWISKFDLYNLKYVAEVRAGINMRNIAISHNGRYILAGNYLPNTMVLFDAHDLSLVQVLPATDTNGKFSRVSAVYQAAPRQSFIVALKDVPEVLELSVDDADKEGGHAFYGHGPFTEEMLRATRTSKIRHIALDDVLDDFFFDPQYRYILGAARSGTSGRVIDLDLGKEIAAIDIDGMPHLGSGIYWQRNGKTVMATPNLKQGLLSIIELGSWKLIKQIKTKGPGFFMRSHEKSKYAWADVFFGPNKDLMHVIDKQSLEIVKTLRPRPGQTAAHIEFTKNGSHALMSIWEDDGALLVYDAKSLELVKTLPMRKPSGKYNVYNKINLSSGTSH